MVPPPVGTLAGGRWMRVERQGREVHLVIVTDSAEDALAFARSVAEQMAQGSLRLSVVDPQTVKPPGPGGRVN